MTVTGCVTRAPRYCSKRASPSTWSPSASAMRGQTALDTYAHVLPDMQRQAAATLGSLLHSLIKS